MTTAAPARETLAADAAARVRQLTRLRAMLLDLITARVAVGVQLANDKGLQALTWTLREALNSDGRDPLLHGILERMEMLFDKASKPTGRDAIDLSEHVAPHLQRCFPGYVVTTVGAPPPPPHTKYLREPEATLTITWAPVSQ